MEELSSEDDDATSVDELADECDSPELELSDMLLVGFRLRLGFGEGALDNSELRLERSELELEEGLLRLLSAIAEYVDAARRPAAVEIRVFMSKENMLLHDMQNSKGEKKEEEEEEEVESFLFCEAGLSFLPKREELPSPSAARPIARHTWY